MHFKKLFVLLPLSITLLLSTSFSYGASYSALKEGSKGSNVTKLQTDLKELGFYSDRVTGYFGSITKTSVIKLQRKYKLTADGVVGNSTVSKIHNLLTNTPTNLKKLSTLRKSSTSRSLSGSRPELLSWFGDAENVFSIGDTATVIDVYTGLRFNIKRTYGHNHADSETLTANDTSIMKEIYGGEFSWERRPIILITHGRKIAASMAGMPHAGRENLPADEWVSNRSEGYGAGYNLDAVKGNNMSGHFDVHFLGSRTHASDRVDEKHQEAVHIAAGYSI